MHGNMFGNRVEVELQAFARIGTGRVRDLA
jgi:hypothetical protein